MEAEAHQEESAKGGRKSAEVRLQKSGTAQPFRSDVEGGFEAPIEGGVEGGAEPNLKPQATNDRAKSEKPKTKSSMRTSSARAVWFLWQQLNEQGTGVKHIAWTPAMDAAARAREAECRGYDFADVAAFALERMAGNAWFKENPDRMTLTHFLRPDNFQRYAANYTPKDQP